jgi:nucleoside-diphosphate-sugar epimerase
MGLEVLFIGGTGLISTACVDLAIARGMNVTLLNRGQRAGEPARGAKVIHADIKDEPAVVAALGDRRWDVVINFMAFTPADIERDLRLFGGRCGQYVFISSASVYQKPLTHYLITESTPLANPYWEYSRNKIASEERLMHALRSDGFPGVIVRPSLTYGPTHLPWGFGSWSRSWTLIDRMQRGRPIIVHGDGQSLWVTTHRDDFAKGLVGLLGNPQTVGHAFHITTNEVMTWDQIYRTVAEAAGVRDLKLIHIASDFLIAQHPASAGGLLGDKSASVVFDNSKIKRFVPGFVCTKPLAEGVRECIAWYRGAVERQVVDEATNALHDRIIESYAGIGR